MEPESKETVEKNGGDNQKKPRCFLGTGQHSAMKREGKTQKLFLALADKRVMNHDKKGVLIA